MPITFVVFWLLYLMVDCDGGLYTATSFVEVFLGCLSLCSIRNLLDLLLWAIGSKSRIPVRLLTNILWFEGLHTKSTASACSEIRWSVFEILSQFAVFVSGSYTILHLLNLVSMVLHNFNHL